MNNLINDLSKNQKRTLLVTCVIVSGVIGYTIYCFNLWIEELTGYTPYEILFFLFLLSLAAFAITVGYLTAIEFFGHLKWTLMDWQKDSKK